METFSMRVGSIIHLTSCGHWCSSALRHEEQVSNARLGYTIKIEECFQNAKDAPVSTIWKPLMAPLAPPHTTLLTTAAAFVPYEVVPWRMASGGH